MVYLHMKYAKFVIYILTWSDVYLLYREPLKHDRVLQEQLFIIGNDWLIPINIRDIRTINGPSHLMRNAFDKGFPTPLQTGFCGCPEPVIMFSFFLLEFVWRVNVCCVSPRMHSYAIPARGSRDYLPLNSVVQTKITGTLRAKSAYIIYVYITKG